MFVGIFVSCRIAYLKVKTGPHVSEWIYKFVTKLAGIVAQQSYEMLDSKPLSINLNSGYFGFYIAALKLKPLT